MDSTAPYLGISALFSSLALSQQTLNPQTPPYIFYDTLQIFSVCVMYSQSQLYIFLQRFLTDKNR